MDIKGRVAVVTGAARGLGKAFSEELLRRGAKSVVVADLDQAAGQATEKEFSKQFGRDAVKFVTCDVTNDDDLTAMFTAAKDLGGLDILINNAGVTSGVGQERCYQVNVFALRKSTEMAATRMRTDEGGVGGVIVNVASISALVNTPIRPVYGPSKAAVISFSAGFARLMGDKTGVRIGVLCPDLVLTDLTKEMKQREEHNTLMEKEEEHIRMVGGWTPKEVVVDACLAIIEKPLPQGTVVRACAKGSVIVKIEEAPVEPLF